MNIETLRDVVIIVFGLMGIIAIIIGSIIVYIRDKELKALIRNFNSTMNSTRNASQTAEKVFNKAEGVVIEIVTIVQAIRQLANVFKKKEEKA